MKDKKLEAENKFFFKEEFSWKKGGGEALDVGRLQYSLIMLSDSSAKLLNI